MCEINQTTMSTVKRPKNLTIGHELAFLYLNLGYITDSELSKEEIETIVEKVGEWYDAADGEDMTAAINESIEWAKSCVEEPGNELVESANRLKATLSENNLRAVLQDMLAVIKADGKVVDGEVKFFEIVADIFGIELN